MRSRSLACLVLLFVICMPVWAQTDAAIKSAKSTVNSATGGLGSYRKFIDNDSVHWKYGGDYTLNFTATSLSNWKSGGNDQIGVSSVVNAYANYKKGSVSWENHLLLGIGMNKVGEYRGKKSDDRLYYTGRLNRSINSKWAYSLALVGRTQLLPGYKFNGNEITAKVSDFCAPINVYLTAGMDYKVSKQLSILASPVMGRALWANSDSLTVLSAAGLVTKEKDENGQEIQVKHHSKYEFGGGLVTNLTGSVLDNKLSYNSQLELFSNYVNNPQNVDVFWTFNTKMVIYKYISADLQLELKYDDDQKIITKTETGDETHGARIQLKNYLGLGFYYKF